MTSDDIVNNYNNTHHSIVKMKPVDVKSNTYIESNKEINDKNPKFKIVDNVRISKYKNVFTKGYIPNWSEEVFAIKKALNTVRWTQVINDLKGEWRRNCWYVLRKRFGKNKSKGIQN